MEKMDISQIIGFVISLLAIVFLTIQKIREERHKRLHPDELKHEAHEGNDGVKNFFKALDIDIEDEDQFSPPKKHLPPQPSIPSAPAKGHKQKSRLQTPSTSIKNNFSNSLPKITKKYGLVEFGQRSRVGSLVKNFPSKKEMVIIHEIIGPPKGLQ